MTSQAFAQRRSDHPQRLQVGFEDRFLLLALLLVLLAQPHHGAQRLHVVAVAFGLGIDIADVVGDRLFFFFQAFDALDDRSELILGESRRGRFLDGVAAVAGMERSSRDADRAATLRKPPPFRKSREKSSTVKA